MSIERVGVVGAGQMGSGIAEVAAKAGANVVVFEPAEELVDAGNDRGEAERVVHGAATIRRIGPQGNCFRAGR